MMADNVIFHRHPSPHQQVQHNQYQVNQQQQKQIPIEEEEQHQYQSYYPNQQLMQQRYVNNHNSIEDNVKRNEHYYDATGNSATISGLCSNDNDTRSNSNFMNKNNDNADEQNNEDNDSLLQSDNDNCFLMKTSTHGYIRVDI